MPNITFDEITAACPRCQMPLTERMLTVARKAMTAMKARILSESPNRRVTSTAVTNEDVPLPPDMNAYIRAAHDPRSATPTEPTPSTRLAGPIPTPSNEVLNAMIRQHRGQEGRR